MLNLAKYISMEDHFKGIERLSEELSKYDNSDYLVIRMDGIGLSKKYLSNSLRNKKFEGLMWQALEDCFEVLHRKCPHDAQNIILSACVFSDEVSIVLSKIPNYYENRIIKILTTFVSTFTSFFTGKGLLKNKKKEPLISGAFDARALILKNRNELMDYFSCRYSIHIRNTATKLLRLNGGDSKEIYNDENFNCLKYIESKSLELNLSKEVTELYEVPIFFVSNKEKLENYRFNSISNMNININKKIEQQEVWLNKFV